MLACDLVVAARTARFGLPEVVHRRRAHLRRLVPCSTRPALNLARQLILTGRPIDAERAYEAGFVNVLTEHGDALESARRLAQDICSNAPPSRSKPALRP